MEQPISRFWETKKLKDFTQEEWEALCDGCGKCCFRKILDGYLWWKKILNTRVCCDLLDTDSCRCKDYENRFSLQPECIKLNRRKLKDFKWLPETCAYRLVFEGKKLFPWHPLISGNKGSVKEAGIFIENPVPEKDCREEDWWDFVI